jgi:hypothetical protein
MRHLSGWTPARWAAVALAVAATTFVPRADTDALYPPPFVLEEGYQRAGIDSYVGVVGISSVRYLRGVTEPVVLVGARPAHVDKGLEVLAVRVVFYGEGKSAFGYRRYESYPAIICWGGPVTGHGPTHPAERAVIGPGDLVYFIVYARAVVPGKWVASGLHLDYVLRNGVHRSVETPEGILEITGHPRDRRLPDDETIRGRCDPAVNYNFAEPWPGYPL